jgi:hypothetical protein
MFTVQTDLWNEMVERIQETYKDSLVAGQKYQDEFSGFISEMFRHNRESIEHMQNETRETINRMMTLSLDNISRFSGILNGNYEHNAKAMRLILDKYNVHNEDLRRELESLWKENTDAFHKNVNELTEMINNTQKQNIDIVMDVFRSTMEKGAKNISKKTEDIREKVTTPEEKKCKKTKKQ